MCEGLYSKENYRQRFFKACFFCFLINITKVFAKFGSKTVKISDYGVNSFCVSSKINKAKEDQDWICSVF